MAVTEALELVANLLIFPIDDNGGGRGGGLDICPTNTELMVATFFGGKGGGSATVLNDDDVC